MQRTGETQEEEPSWSTSPLPSGVGRAQVQTERVLVGQDVVLFGILSLCGAAGIGLFVAGVVRAADWKYHPAAVVTVLVVIGVMIANHQGRWYLLPLMRRPVHLEPPAGLRVALVATYVPGAESLVMIERTLIAIKKVEYPHDSWLLDEGATDEARALCEQLGVRYFTRQGNPHFEHDDGPFRKGTKYGNYNAWLTAVGYAEYDILVAFDPDHVPFPDYLDRVLGYFRDPAVGYVQAPQAFYNQSASFISRGAAEESYAFYSVVQMAAYGAGFPVIVGSHNSHRVTALREVGGLAAHDADDLLMTLNYRAARWEGVFVPEILARGLVPTDWKSYLTQQRRWARSVLDIKLRQRGRFSSGLPRGARIMSFLHGFAYLHRAILIAVSLLVFIFLLVANETPRLVQRPPYLEIVLLAMILMLMELFRERFILDRPLFRRPHWRMVVLEFAKWPWFLLALADVALGRKLPYSTTRKSGRSGIAVAFVAVHLCIAAVIVTALIIALLRQGDVVPVLKVTGLLASTFFCGLALTGLVRYPPPFDSAITPHQRVPGLD